MHPAILVGAGFLAGTAGVKAVTSKTARKIYVKGLVQSLKAKENCESLVEEAKASSMTLWQKRSIRQRASKKVLKKLSLRVNAHRTRRSRRAGLCAIP